jgi:uncharacterized repeat protein (TIGR01451 family)
MVIKKRSSLIEKRFLIAFCVFFLSLVNANRALGQTTGPIGPGFFGMSVNDVPSAPWPATLGVPFGSWRTLGVEVKWSDIEQCDGGSDPTNACYAWSDLDTWVSQAQASGQDIMYTIYSTPTWASSKPTDTSCVRGSSFPAGSCDPPNDIDAVPGSGLGDGTNKHFQDFLNAMMSHLGAGKIKYWEVWDEPSVARAWKGTNAQLVRLAKDTFAIVKAQDPSALTATPPFVGNGIRQPFLSYLQAGGGQYADIIDYHGYLQTGTCPNDCPIPENEGLQIGVLDGVLQTAGQLGKPVFDTEGSWGNYLGTETITDPDQQVAFTGRYYLMHLSGNVSKVYWYSWNNQENGHFYDIPGATIIPAGTAYEQIYNWLVGATLTAPCTNFNTQWFCPFSRPSSYVAQAIWDTNSSLLCSGGVCPTVNVAVPTHYTQYRDLKGNLTSITSQTVPAGSKPILVEGTTPNISITKSVSPSVGQVGGTVTYTIVVTNNTGAAISPVTVVDNLDPSLSFTSCSSTPHGVCTSGTNSVTVTFGSMASKETDTITIVVNIASTATGTILNTATANWTSASSVSSDNWSTVALPIGTPGASVKPGTLNFGNQTVNTTSFVKNAVVTNTGTGNLVIYNIGTTGNNSADFSFTSNPLPITVTPQSKTTIGVQLKPSGLGNRTASLYIYDNTSSGTLTVGLAGNGVSPTTTSLSSSVNPALFGQSIVFTAVVSCSSSFTPTGTVSFKKLNTVLGTGTLNSSGTTTFTTSTLPVGWQTITAVYSSDVNCGTSSGSVAQGVKLPSAVTLTSTLNPSTSGQPVTFHANVSSSGGGTPSGSVTFKDGGTKLGTVTLDASGNASFTTSTLKVGTHSITSSYGGSPTYFPSNSPVLKQTVN